MVKLSLKEMALSDCPSEKAFWFRNGVLARNMKELADNIEKLSEFDFKYHVNDDKQKNDFADWIRGVLGDEELSNTLQQIYEKDKYIDLIRKRMNELEQS